MAEDESRAMSVDGAGDTSGRPAVCKSPVQSAVNQALVWRDSGKKQFCIHLIRLSEWRRACRSTTRAPDDFSLARKDCTKRLTS